MATNTSWKGSIEYPVDLGIAGQLDVTIRYTFTPGRPGKMYLKNGDPGYPADPCEVDIDEVLSGDHDVTWLLSEAISNDDGIISRIIENENSI